MATQDWYSRQGWEVYKRMDKGYTATLGNGELYVVDVLFMKKAIA